MPTEHLVSSSGQNTNVDEFALPGQAAAQVVNLMVDEAGTNTTRPGLSSWSTPSAAPRYFIGMAEHDNTLVAMLDDRAVYSITSAGTATNITDDTPGGDQDPTFFEIDDGRMVILDGGHPSVIGPGGRVSRFLVSSPYAPRATHGGIVDRTLLLNDLTHPGRIYYSAPDNQAAFADTPASSIATGAGYFTAGTRSDDVTAMAVVNNVLIVFGSKSVEAWYGTGRDGDPFNLDDNPIQSELLAPRSVVEANGTLWWLDGDRNIVRLDGRQAVTVSQAIADQLLQMGTVTDCRGHNVELQGHRYVAFSFPSEAVTLLFDYEKNLWCEWRRWNTTLASWLSMPMRAYAKHRAWNRHFCGGDLNGKVYELSSTTYRDDGSPIRRLRRSGFVDHGTLARKFCNKLRFLVDGGVAQTHTTTEEGYDPVLEVRWRDEDYMWSKWRHLELGKIGENTKVRPLNRLGSYRRRQYEWQCSAPVPFKVSRVEEDFDLGVL